jgi:EAL domain-containing protein (putative c-di-GMP-specific phosphodiesterase class I)
VLAGLGLFALIAMCCAVYLAASGQNQGLVVSGAILVLAVGQMAMLAVLGRRRSGAGNRDAQNARNLRGMAESMRSLDERLAALESQPATPAGLLESIAAEVRSLRDSIGGLVQGSEPPKAEAPPPEPMPSAEPQVADPERETVDANERIELMLEPIIELSSGSTLHYRALLSLADDQGNRFGHDQLMGKAEEGGMRDILDSHALKLVAPVLRRLRVRNPGMRVFVSLGGTTLGSPAGTARLLTVLEQERDIASGIVFEISQDTLASLNKTGIESLAQFGRMGATMALSNVAVAGVDLPALRQLGVKFLSIAAAAFDAGFGAASAWRDFTQYARAMQFQIIATGIHSAQQASAATTIVRFGSGPFFAPPRKVKSDAGFTPGQRQASAA